MFVDKVKVYVKAGNGGNGCVSFLREKYVAKGGPDGGDGGNGGSVIFVADTSESSLVNLKYQQHQSADNGVPGQGKQKHGARGNNKIIKVPVGTLIMDQENDYELLADLNKPGESYLAAQGGRGGKGNLRFVSSTNRTPRQFEEGIQGEEKTLFLELKIIADAGLVGYPNAGKSTFLASVSNALPKIAPYPFTTINPQIGVIKFEDYTKITLADIPGLIEGASENIGLGHDFLKHIERTRVLVYVLDMAGTDGRNPTEDLKSLINELDLYKEKLSDKAKLILANKIDDPDAEKNIEELKKHTDLPIIEMAAGMDENTEEAILKIKELVEEVKKSEPQETTDFKKEEDNKIIEIDLNNESDDFDFDEFDDDDNDAAGDDNFIYIFE